MRRAWLNLRRHAVPERIEAFTQGLQRHGFEVVHGLTQCPGDRDLLATWNRIGDGNRAAEVFTARGLNVLVAENATWGNDFAGGHWYTLANGHHNVAGRFPVGGPERWDRLGVELSEWLQGGSEVVILPQRGIGSPPVAMPHGWAERTWQRVGGRIRRHPGQGPCVPLRDDLARARCVWTWGSGAAIKALLWGIPVHSEMPGWIGEQDNTDAGRLSMFRRLAWAQWRLDEIRKGEAFAHVLS